MKGQARSVLSRREFMSLLGSGMGALALGRGRAGAGEATEGDRRPNIVFLLTDDQRARTLGVDGHPVIRTPNLDRLAAE